MKVIHEPKMLNASLFRKLKKLEKSFKFGPKQRFIPLSYVYKQLCGSFSIPKEELKRIFHKLDESDLVEFSKAGIKLNFEVKE